MSKFVILLVVSLAVFIAADDAGAPDLFKNIMDDFAKPVELAQDAVKDMANAPASFYKTFTSRLSSATETKNGQVVKNEHHAHVEQNDNGNQSVYDS